MKYHNKAKNIGIIFESMIKSVIENVAMKKLTEATETFKILKKYFMNPNTEMSKAYKIYSQILYTEANNYYYASKFLNYLLKEAKSNIDIYELNNELKEMVKEIEGVTKFKDMMSLKTENYKLYSSFKILLDEKNNQFTIPSNTRISCEKTLLEYMVSKDENPFLKESSKLLESSKNLEDIDTQKFAITLALDKFKQKYKNSLNEEQMTIINKYFESDSKVFSRFVEKKAKGIIKEIQSKKDSIEKEEIVEKLELVEEKLNQMVNSDIDTNKFSDLLMCVKLRDQLQSLGE